eukprot:5148137-Pyramimonas_sp.AAC.1
MQRARHRGPRRGATGAPLARAQLLQVCQRRGQPRRFGSWSRPASLPRPPGWTSLSAWPWPRARGPRPAGCWLRAAR